ncbi:hypothetical protein ACEPAF_5453 [Sanghuangporus sanghuang]
MDTILGMFGGGEGFTPFSESRAQEHYRDLYLSDQPTHEANWTHEAIAAAAGFAAMHAYEAHLRATGQPVSHGKMKEILAAIAAAEIDKLAETRGLDWVDRHRAKKLAEQQAHALAAERYGEYNTGWEYASAQQGPAREYDFYGGAPGMAHRAGMRKVEDTAEDTAEDTEEDTEEEDMKEDQVTEAVAMQAAILLPVATLRSSKAMAEEDTHRNITEDTNSRWTRERTTICNGA